ncbi:DNA polymerase III epsilon subunit [Pseudohaliea rubra DSM 19751]|uniref:DNA polymerase III epsilon subunit n=1 Tax=Pseudohaliea rubra DSM 19751 TaxID=1265313 RepID=A0A095X209_9GAMM|nr:DNA polymerase III epsilon subunit [Pseudohaliea rubra DSM 19751]
MEFLVCDGEMSSLEAADGELLSLGWLPVRKGAAVLDGAEHRVLRPSGGVGQSAVVHQLRDVDLVGGEAPATVLEAFLAAARGRVLVFHNARLDLAYLDRLCQGCFGVPLLLPVVDTLRLEQRLLARRDRAPKAGDLTLGGCRARYGLPAYAAHNALADALATAELLLAHAASRGAGLKLKDLL